MSTPESAVLDESPAVPANDPVPGIAETIAKVEQQVVEQLIGYRIGVDLWGLHTRKCRRALEAKHIYPHEVVKHMAACICGYPQARIEQSNRAQAEAAQQAQADLDRAKSEMVLDVGG